MDPDRPAGDGLTSTVTFPARQSGARKARSSRALRSTPAWSDADGVYRKTGPARVFTHRAGGRSPQSRAATIQAGDVLVLICRGPMGSGMEETYQITSALKYLAFGKHVAVITDARFSGVSTGACIGHVSPEALAGGPIGKVRDGDLIEIVVDRVKLEGTVNLVVDGSAEEGSRLRRYSTPRRPGARSRIARCHAVVGGTAGRKRRHVGRLRFRCGRGDAPARGG